MYLKSPYGNTKINADRLSQKLNLDIVKISEVLTIQE